MKKIYLLLVFVILSINILVTGCAILSHEKSYHQTVECKDNRPIVKTFYGSDIDYMKIKEVSGCKK